MFFGLPKFRLLEGLQASFRCAVGFFRARRKVTASVTNDGREPYQILSVKRMVVAHFWDDRRMVRSGGLPRVQAVGECPGSTEVRHSSVSRCKSQQAARDLKRAWVGRPLCPPARRAVTFIPSRYQNVTIFSYLRYGRFRADSLQGRHSRVDCLTLPLPGIRSQNSSGRDGETTFGLVQALG